MCVTVTKYQNLINMLVRETYPALHQSLNNISAADAGELTDGVKEAIPAFQKEFRSLESFERKLIFPSILSMFSENEDENSTAPDIDAIINLTNIREDRLCSSIEKISEILQHNETELLKKNKINSVEECRELINIFYSSFLPQKKKWKQLLVHLHNEPADCSNRIQGKCRCSKDAYDNDIS